MTGTTYTDGVAPAPTNSGGTITLAPGTYTIDYTVIGDAAGGTEQVGGYLKLNGTEVPGSRVWTGQNSTSSPAYVTASNTVTITVAATSTLTLNNDWTLWNNVAPQSGANDTITASMNIERVF